MCVGNPNSSTFFFFILLLFFFFKFFLFFFLFLSSWWKSALANLPSTLERGKEKSVTGGAYPPKFKKRSGSPSGRSSGEKTECVKEREKKERERASPDDDDDF